MKQAVKSALGLGNASTAAIAPVGAPLANTRLSAYGPTVATIPIAQTITVPTVVDTVETIQQPIIKETTTVQKQVIPAVVEHREVAPVVHQRIRQEEVEEFQPVIHREREKTEIHKIVQPLYTTATMGIAAEEKTLAAQVRPEVRISGQAPPPSILPTTEYESAQKVRIDKAPIIMETERKKIIEEVQPVLYKEVIQPHVIRITQPIYEKIIEADVYIDRVLPATTIAAPPPTVMTTISAPIVQQVTPLVSTSTLNVAEPTSAFTQTFEVTTPVNTPGISANRIEGVSQGVQVAPLSVTVQPLPSQGSLGIQQPVSSLSSTSFQALPQQQYLGAQSSLLSSQGGLAQPGFASGLGGQQPLSMQQFPQSSLGMQPGFQQGLSQPGFQQGLSQQGFQQGLSQPGFQQGLSQPGFQQGLSQPGFQQGLSQPGFQQGLSQPGFQQGLGQSSMGLGQSNMGMQQEGLTQGLASGLGQSIGQQFGSSLGGMSKGLGGMGSALGSLGGATSAF